jgi:hypothetical protein
MESSRRHWNLIAFIFALLVIPFLVNSVSAQGLMRGSGLDLAPTNPFGTPGFTAGLPQGSNSLYLNSGMFRDILGPIPNLEIGYLYQFGNNIRTGRLSLDYVFPATVWDNQAVFAEAHGEFTNFWKTLQRLLRSGNSTTSYNGYPERTDLSFGGGYRKLLGDSLMLGVNGFYDTTKLGSRWYGSGGLGFEMATLGAGNDLIELTFNYYGDIFQGRNSIINAFRNGPSNFDVSARYSIELGDYGPDLRLKATGYQFDIGTRRYGWNTEAEVRTRNGMFSVKAGTGHDPVNGWYHTVGGFFQPAQWQEPLRDARTDLQESEKPEKNTREKSGEEVFTTRGSDHGSTVHRRFLSDFSGVDPVGTRRRRLPSLSSDHLLRFPLAPTQYRLGIPARRRGQEDVSQRSHCAFPG